MTLAKRQIDRRVGFEKCLIPWKELMLDSTFPQKIYNTPKKNIYSGK